MVVKVNHSQLGELIDVYYGTKEPLFIWGTFGIGKSRVVGDKAKKIAEQKGKQFVEWIKTTREQKQEIFANPEKYFVLIDIRLSEYDSSDIKGLPIFKDDKLSIEFKVPFWALFLENLKSDGVLLFDEVNLAPPLVVSSCYKIIYDRVINESRINDNWLILGCGNLSGDRAYTHELSPPLRDRGGEVELVTDSNEWFNWATQEQVGIKPEIIGFLNWKSEGLRQVDFEDEQKFTTPRGWERVNKLIKKQEFNNKTYDKIKMIVSSAIGEGIATEFIAYCKIQELINLEEMIKNPARIGPELKDRGIDVRYFVTTAVADKYKDKKIDFKRVVEISKEFDSLGEIELVAYMWNLCSKFSKKFKDDFVKSVDNELCSKYSKYLM
jgi:hypothetical protein